MTDQSILEINPHTIDSTQIKDKYLKLPFETKLLLETNIKLDSPRTKSIIEQLGYHESDLIKRDRSYFRKEQESQTLTTQKHNLHLIQLSIRLNEIIRRRKNNQSLVKDFTRSISQEFSSIQKLDRLNEGLTRASTNREVHLQQTVRKAKQFNIKTKETQKKMKTLQEEIYRILTQKRREAQQKDNYLTHRLESQKQGAEQLKFQKQMIYQEKQSEYTQRVQQFQEQYEIEQELKFQELQKKQEKIQRQIEKEKNLRKEHINQLQQRYNETKTRADQMLLEKEVKQLQDFYSSSISKEHQLLEKEKQKKDEIRSLIKRHQKKMERFQKSKEKSDHDYSQKLMRINYSLDNKSKRFDSMKQSRLNSKVDKTDAMTNEKIFMQTEVAIEPTENYTSLLKSRIKTQQSLGNKRVDDILVSRLRERRQRDQFEEDFNEFFTTKNPKKLAEKLKRYNLQESTIPSKYFDYYCDL